MRCGYCDFCLQDGGDGYEVYAGLRDMPIEVDLDGYVQLSMVDMDGERKAFMEMYLEGEKDFESIDIGGFIEIKYCPICGRNLLLEREG